MNTVKVLVVGCGNMGASHARAYHRLDGFELAGLVARTPERRSKLAAELGGVAEFDDFSAAFREVKPDAVSICTYPDTHAGFARESLKAQCHVFIEKPLAESVEEAREIAALAKSSGRKLVVGYILRHSPAWMQFVDVARTLGKPLIMRMNLNQQSSGAEWRVHKHLMESMSPIVDCGVHYVDIMCQMTRSKPVQVQAIGARVSDEIADDMYNYGQLQVKFEDGSVGWYEAGWGPMMSETAYFVKDVIGPKGCVSIVDPNASGQMDTSDVDAHTKTNALLKHSSKVDVDGNLVQEDVLINTKDEPDHQELCNREQSFFLKAIQENLDLTDHIEDAVNSLRIVLAADESVRTGKIVRL